MDLFKLAKSVFNFLSRQWKLILIFFVSGLLLGTMYDQIKTPYYETSAIATSGLSFFEGIIDPSQMSYQIIDQKIAIDMINSLSQVVKDQEYEILAKKLQIPLEQAIKIKFIEAEQSYELDLENRRQKQSQFIITAKLTDNSTIDLLNDGLLSFFNNNIYSNKNYNIFQRQSPELISYLDEEINDLKFFRENLMNKSNIEQNSVMISDKSGQSLQNQIIQLYQKKHELERDLELLRPLSFVSEFPTYKEPKSRTLVRIFIMSVGFLILGLFFSLIREIKNN